MPLTLNNTNTLTADNIFVSGTNLSDLYATINYVNTNSGGISQQDVDDSLAPLFSKDIAYNSTLTSHISLIDTNTTDIATHTNDISVLNTKQIQNFAGITDINTNLTNNYQTNSQLSTNFYNKTEIDTSLNNYYTQAVANTVFYSQTYVNNNIYTKTEVDGLIAGAGGGGGYTDTEIDNFLNLKEDKSTFTDRFSVFPIIECSIPTIIHQGLTLKNSVVNVEPLEGLLFSNQFGAEVDRVVSVFKNQTNYISLQGNKIIANATSDDSLTVLDLNPANNVKISNLTIGDITVPNTGSDIIRNSGDANYTLRVRDTQGVWEFRNRNFRCMNPSNPANGTEMILHDTGNDYRLRIGSQTNAQVGIGVQYNSSYFLNVGGLSNFNQARVATDLEVIGNLDLTSSTGDIQIPLTGMDIHRSSGDSNYSLRVRDGQGVFEFRNRTFNCLNASNTGIGTLMELQNTNTAEIRVGSATNARMGIGANPVLGFHLTVGGTSQFGWVRINQNLTVVGNYWVDTNGRIFQRADASNSLNIVSTGQINFSLQTDRATDPTTGTIALQLDDTNGITINRAVINNQTFNSIGRMTAESDLDVWGELFFQHSSSIKETLNGSDYDLDIRNGDTDRAINFIIGTIGSTPELQLTEGKVNLLGNLEITHTDVAGSQRVLINNPDTDGFIRLSNNNLSRLDATNDGVDVYGDLSYTGSLIPSSDKRLKKDIKELNSKKAVELVKYIKPKTYHFIDDRQKGKSCCGFIANDFMETKKLPDEWQNLVKEGTDGYLKFDYTITTPILWSALQATINEVDKLKKEVNKLKGKGKGNRRDSN